MPSAEPPPNMYTRGVPEEEPVADNAAAWPSLPAGSSPPTLVSNFRHERVTSYGRGALCSFPISRELDLALNNREREREREVNVCGGALVTRKSGFGAKKKYK